LLFLSYNYLFCLCGSGFAKFPIVWLKLTEKPYIFNMFLDIWTPLYMKVKYKNAEIFIVHNIY